MTKMKKLAVILFAVVALPLLTAAACERDAQVASRNLSVAADMFEIQRRIVFLNGITDRYILMIEGRCSIHDDTNQLEVTCKTGPNAFKKHFLGLSDNVTYFAEQIETVDVSVFHNRIVWKPQSVVPDIDFRGDADALIKAVVPD